MYVTRGRRGSKNSKILWTSYMDAPLQLKVDIDANRETAYVYNSSGSLGLAAQRHRLPIARYKDHILYLLEKHQVVVIVGETGCGKSTQIPQYLYEAGWCSEPGTMVSSCA